MADNKKPAKKRDCGGAPGQPCKRKAKKGEQLCPVHLNLGEYSAKLDCPYCNKPIHTITKEIAGTLTYLICTLLCLIGCMCGCCLIPCFIRDFKDVEHSCPNCHEIIGRFRRLE